MDDLALAAVEAALAAGATYADARALTARSETLAARNGVLESADRSTSAGIGVRAMIGSSWGFFSVPDLSPAAARQAGTRAAEVARASPDGVGACRSSCPTRSPSPARWENEVREDPFAVSLAEKGDLLEGVTARDARRRRGHRGGVQPRLADAQVVRVQRGVAHRADASPSAARR